MKETTEAIEAPQPQETEATETPERDLLQAVVEALDLPVPATAGGEDAYYRLLAHRAGLIFADLRLALQHADAVPVMAAHLRKEAADTKVSYKVWGGES